MKIALLGSAPSSRMLAPFNDPDWEIWACSPGNMDLPRFDVFFEIHGMDTTLREAQYNTIQPGNGITFVDFCKRQPKIYMQESRPEYPGSIKYPFEEMKDKFGRFFWNSSLSYMLAMAIDRKPDTIGLFGVDMSAAEEYHQQRPGCQFFIQRAEEAGIKIVVPFESDILEPAPPYGFREASPMWWKWNTRYRELAGKRQALQAQEAEAQRILAESRRQAAILEGAMSDVQYMCDTYHR